MPADAQAQSAIVNFLWSIAELLRDAFKKSENQNVILPFTVLRRLDHALASSKAAVLAAEAKYKALGLENRDQMLRKASGFAFYNTTALDYDACLDAGSEHLAANLRKYLSGFSDNIQEIFRRFRFDDVLRDLNAVNRLFQVASKFNEKTVLNLAPYHPKTNPDGLTNHQMGMVFEQLVRRFNEAVNENPGEHYTPRDAIRLLVRLALALDPDAVTVPGITRTIGDCCAATGGLPILAREEIKRAHRAHFRKTQPGLTDEDYARSLAPKVHIFGQELNPQTWAIGQSELFLLNPEATGERSEFYLGSVLAHDGFSPLRLDWQLANPPYGTEWKVDQKAVEEEHARGTGGRFAPGLPRISDGQLLFMLHKLAHMNPDAFSLVGVVSNGSPLFSGEAGGGESEIRRHILERDLLYAVVGLPEQLFYNTGIQTYLWLLTNRKPADSEGKVMLLDASGPEFWTQLSRSLGNKRREIADHQIDRITELFTTYRPGEHTRIFPVSEFGYRRIQIERPLRLNFAPTPLRLERLFAQTGFRALALSKKREPAVRAAEEEAGRQLQAQIIKLLRHLPATAEPAPASLAAEGTTEEPITPPAFFTRDHAVFIAAVESAFTAAGLKLSTALEKALVAALGERDEAAQPVLDEERPPGEDEAAALFTERFGWWPSAAPAAKRAAAKTPATRRRYLPDAELRDYENVAITEDVAAYFDREVRPHLADAWINADFRDARDQQIGKVGYEVNFNRYFFNYTPPRDLGVIDADLRAVEGDILDLLKEVMA
jgi:type I restriction enzyme M protein